jgi:SM-20-related protein
MQLNPSPPMSDELARDEGSEPLLEVIEDLVPADLQRAAWTVCSSQRWYFGHGSHEGDWSRFWKMDLDGDGTFNAIWEHVRPRCEALAGAPLRVIRQYANGHTYGLGGQPHLDDDRPGCYTLLYYANTEWKDGWEGETVYFDAAGEIALAVKPRPNRGVLFDSRILHAGRAPSRICPALRVTVAYKLEVSGLPVVARTPEEEPAESAEICVQQRGPSSVPNLPVQAPGAEAALCTELAESRNGALRVYQLRVASSVVEQAVAEHLARLGQSVRLPGFRPGKIPMPVLQQRYGARARREAVNRIVAETSDRMLPKGSVVGSFTLCAGAESGDLEFQAYITYLPDLPGVDFSAFSIERLHATGEDLGSASLSAADAAALFRQHLKLQVLDHLDAAYPIPLLPFLIEREFASIWKAAEIQSALPAGAPQREVLVIEFRAMAERRLRLGMVVAEIASRSGIRAQHPAELEDKVVDFLVTQARVQERQTSLEELRELAEAE